MACRWRAWCEALAADGATMVLLPITGRSRQPPVPRLSWVRSVRGAGAWSPAHADPRGVAAGWLELGARVIGIAAEATPDALRPLVEARDAAVAADREATRRAAVIDAWVARRGQRAAGGRALWVGDQPAMLPDGFDWTIVPATASGRSRPGVAAAHQRRRARPARRRSPRGARRHRRGSTDDPEALVPRRVPQVCGWTWSTPPVAGECRYIGRRED